jgi:hypothetical protein
MLRDSLRAHVRQCQQTLAALDGILTEADPAELPDLPAARVLVSLSTIAVELDQMVDALGDVGLQTDVVEPATIAQEMPR